MLKLDPRRKQNKTLFFFFFSFFLRYYLIYNNKKSQRIFEKNNNDKGYIYFVHNSQILISSSGFSERIDRFRQITQFENERKKTKFRFPQKRSYPETKFQSVFQCLKEKMRKKKKLIRDNQQMLIRIRERKQIK